MYRLTHLLLSAFVVSASLVAPLGAIKKNMAAAARAEDTLRKAIDAWKARADKIMNMPHETDNQKDTEKAAHHQFFRDGKAIQKRCEEARKPDWKEEVHQKIVEVQKHRKTFINKWVSRFNNESNNKGGNK
ncbi:hypothetical protein EIL50_02350 [bacterium NHP-B]|nr:hypothetical protein EIL50_02350 [bacterium NHP-B]